MTEEQGPKPSFWIGHKAEAAKEAVAGYCADYFPAPGFVLLRRRWRWLSALAIDGSTRRCAIRWWRGDQSAQTGGRGERRLTHFHFSAPFSLRVERPWRLTVHGLELRLGHASYAIRTLRRTTWLRKFRSIRSGRKKFH